jgi:hypothetical protein
MYAALRSVELNGQAVKIADITQAAQQRLTEWSRNVA